MTVWVGADTAQILNPLRSAGWIKKQSEDKDFSVLFAVLVGALDIRKNLEELCAVLPFAEKGEREHPLDLMELLNAMTCLGHVPNALHVDLVDLDHRLCPCLFVPEKRDNEKQDVFVVLAREDNSFIIHKQNSYKEETLHVTAPLKGTVWIFVPEANHQNTLTKERMEAAGHNWFRALLEKFKPSAGPVIMIGGMLTMLALVAPLFVMMVYDRVIGGHAPEALIPLLIGAVLALSIEAGLRIMRAQTLSWYGARLDYVVSTHIFERLIKLPVLFTERASVAAQIARVRAFDAVRAFFTGPQILALAELPFTLLLLGVIALIGGSLVLVPIIAGACYGALFLAMRPSVKTAMRLSAVSGSSRQEMMIETFEKIDALRAGGLTSVWFREYRDRSGKASMAGFQASWLGAVLEAFGHALYICAGLALVVTGVLQIWAENMSAGSLIACMIMSWRVLAPMQTLCNALPRLVQLQNAIGQINRLMALDGEGSEGKVTARLDTPKGEILFNRVGLRYTKDTDPVFTGLEFEARAGQLIAITGGNGSGKSTVLKLINGLYRPQAGSIHIDGIDIRQVDPQHLRSHIAYVPQTPNIFYGSVADNLRFANPLASDEQLQDALEQADLWQYVEKLPLGLLTVIGNQGDEQLPTGLAYNIGLARAYVQDTPVMVFDELPYAFLNSHAGATFKTKLQEWKNEKTILLVTHREDYMELADQVVLLRRGARPLVDVPAVIVRNIYEQQEAA